MSRQGIVTFPPLRVDLAISRSCARAATPARERSLQVMTWLADEKILLGVVGLFWLTAQLRSQEKEVRHEANRMLLSVAIAGLLPDVFKYLVNRKRPDRALVHGPTTWDPALWRRLELLSVRTCPAPWRYCRSALAPRIEAIQALRVGRPSRPGVHTHHASCPLRERCCRRTGARRGVWVRRFEK